MILNINKDSLKLAKYLVEKVEEIGFAGKTNQEQIWLMRDWIENYEEDSK